MLGHPVKVNVLDVLRNVKQKCLQTNGQKTDKRTDGITPISKET